MKVYFDTVCHLLPIVGIPLIILIFAGAAAGRWLHGRRATGGLLLRTLFISCGVSFLSCLLLAAALMGWMIDSAPAPD